MRGNGGSDGEGRIDRREPVGLDAGMQRMPDEIGGDGPEHHVDEYPRRHRAGLAVSERMQPHGAEDEDARRCERDLGRDQLADEGDPKVLHHRPSADLL
jgi:hypothetical protein